MEWGTWENCCTQLRSQRGSRYLSLASSHSKMPHKTLCVNTSTDIITWRDPLITSFAIYHLYVQTWCEVTKYNIYTFIHCLQYWIKHEVGLESPSCPSIIHALPIIFFWTPGLLNHAPLHTLTAHSLHNRSVAADADNIVFLSYTLSFSTKSFYRSKYPSRRL